jgi:hypothetical protein
MARRGDAFKCLLPPGHVFIVLSEPDSDGNAVIVNLTSHPTVWDDACVLQPEDYPAFVIKPTIAYYDRAMHGPVASLENTDNFRSFVAPSPATLDRIRRGALVSDFLKERLRDIVKAEIDAESNG